MIQARWVEYQYKHVFPSNNAMNLFVRKSEGSNDEDYSTSLKMLCANIYPRLFMLCLLYHGLQVHDDEPLMEAGMDSLSIVELRNSINETFNLNLAATFLFDFPTISKIASHVFESLLGQSNNKALLPNGREAQASPSHYVPSARMGITSTVIGIVDKILGPLDLQQVRPISL